MTKPNTLTRQASRNDLSALGSIDVASGSWHGLSAYDHATEINQTVVVTVSGIAVAYAMLGVTGWPFNARAPHYLRTVQVHPDQRRRGYGKLAVDAACWLAQEANPEHPANFVMSAASPADSVSRDLLVKAGFACTAIEGLPGQGDHTAIYCRDLTLHPPVPAARPVA